MLLPPTSSEADSTHPWQADNNQSSMVNTFVLSQLAAPLQRVQNAAARLICGFGPRDHVTPTVYELHWLPVEQRVTFKLRALMHLIHTGCSASYMSELVT